MSSDGLIVAIGAAGNRQGRGHVRVHAYNPYVENWDQVGSDIDGDATGDSSGAAVALSSNGKVVAVAAPLNDNGGGTDAGRRV